MSLLTILLGLLAITAETTVAQVDLDESPDWSVIASDGVIAELTRTPGVSGEALRLAFEFRQGSGFCVVRRPVAIDLPVNYRVSFRLRGEAPANNLELKLIDPANENVWWVNRRGFDFPAGWTPMVSRARHFEFAWGPSGGRRLARIGFIEFAVAAGSGGKGWVEIDDLRFEPLPEAGPVVGPLAVKVSSTAPDVEAPRTIAADGAVTWRSATDDTSPTMTIDFGGAREFGGLAVDWAGKDFAVDYDVETSPDGAAWTAAASRKGGDGGRDYLRLPDGEAVWLRVVVRKPSRSGSVSMKSLRVLPPAFAESDNAAMETIARDAPPGWYPAYYLGRQTPWTVVGVPSDTEEALIDVHGAVEPARLGFRIEPLLRVGDRLLTWADGETEPTLAREVLPIPSVRWRGAGLEVTTTAFAEGQPGRSNLALRYEVRNTSDQPARVELLLALRPFQVLPPWQNLNITGGAARVEKIRFEGRRVIINNERKVWMLNEPAAIGGAAFLDGDIVVRLAAGETPEAASVADPAGLASGVIVYRFELAAGAAQSVALLTALHGGDPSADWRDSRSAPNATVAEHLSQVAAGWEQTISQARLSLPPAAAGVQRAFTTAQAHILINRDGPSIQPGSRTYERSWMRDGALTSTALLMTGHADAVREFIDWFAAHQYDSGKIPCVVDRRGPDPVPEHDSHGQFIYAVATYHRFTKDRSFVETQWPRVVRTVEYIESLRAQRLTDEYRDGPPEKRACYGLVPESISHEGYSAKPMHSYWDDFFILRGLRDATYLAGVVERPEVAARFDQLRADFEKSLYASIDLAMKTKAIDYIPGCVELGDFDATSTAIALYPCGEQSRLPQAAMQRTFERYYEFFVERREGRLDWQAYTPYEVRLIGTFVRLGRRDRALELIDYFLKDQSPPGWNQWAEVAWNDKSAPKFIGDMPHTWVASDFVSAVRSLFVYEDEDAGSLVLAAGVPWSWIEAPAGVRIENFPTHHGPISYHLRAEGRRVTIRFEGAALAPPGGVVLALPDPPGGGSPTVVEGRATLTNGRPTLPVAAGLIVLEYAP